MHADCQLWRHKPRARALFTLVCIVFIKNALTFYLSVLRMRRRAARAAVPVPRLPVPVPMQLRPGRLRGLSWTSVGKLAADDAAGHQAAVSWEAFVFRVECFLQFLVWIAFYTKYFKWFLQFWIILIIKKKLKHFLKFFTNFNNFLLFTFRFICFSGWFNLKRRCCCFFRGCFNGNTAWDRQ